MDKNAINCDHSHLQLQCNWSALYGSELFEILFYQLFLVFSWFIMTSKVFLVFMFLILQCGLVLSSSNLPRSLNNNVKNSPIQVSELVNELRREGSDIKNFHYLLMIMVHSYGGRLYDVSKNVSIECSRTIRATMLTLENLAVCEVANAALGMEYKAAVRDERNAKQLDEHPLELFCSRIEKSLSGNPTLSATFEKAKKEAATFNFISRPPYARMLLTSADSVVFKFIELLGIPEFARLMALGTFADQTDVKEKYSWRIHYFAKCCQAVAKSQQFAGSIQSLYGKVIDETIQEISVDDRVERFFAAIDKRGVYWVPKMMKTFYGHIASDANLKKELESMAAIVGKNATKEDLDFSKL